MTKLEAIEKLLTAMASVDMNVIGDRTADVAFDALWNRLCALRLAAELNKPIMPGIAKGGRV